jgi:hypothetical protein
VWPRLRVYLTISRVQAIAYGLFATCAWLAALRLNPHMFWSTPILPWSLCAITVAVGLYLEMRLHRREMGTPKVSTPPPSGNEAPLHSEPERRTPTYSTDSNSAPLLADTPKL